MTPQTLQADCNACVGLCCVALPFDAEQGFGFDKPAQTPCRHLQTDFRCAIHTQLAEQGFSGCVAFDCHGAGQRTTRMFGVRPDWSQPDAITPDMFEAFFILRRLHELLLLATTAQRYLQGRHLEQLNNWLEPWQGRLDALGLQGLPGLRSVDLPLEQAFLKQLLDPLRNRHKPIQ